MSPDDPGLDPGLAGFLAFHDAIKSGAPVPPVAAEDVKYLWNSWQRLLKRVPQLKERPAMIGNVWGDDNPFARLGEKAPAVYHRYAKIMILVQQGDVAEDEVDDAVCRVAATAPAAYVSERIRREVLLHRIQDYEATIERLEHGWESSVDMMGELRDKFFESDKKLKAAEQRIRELEEELRGKRGGTG